MSELTSMGDYWAGLRDEIAAKARIVPDDPQRSVCPICGGIGWFTYSNVPVGHPLFGKPQCCTNPQCEAGQARAERALKNYELPKNYRKLTFAGWEALPDELKEGKWAAYLAARAFAQHPQHWVNLRETYRDILDIWQNAPDVAKNSLVFYGPMGVGKTGFVAAIMNEGSQKGETGILYRRTSDLIEDLQAAFDDRESEQGEMSLARRMGRYKTARVLILDEWNLKKYTDFALQKMEDIIRYRHGNEMPTLITTNLTPDAFADNWTERTVDVLFEMAHCIPVDTPKLRGA